jgi:hypothetical protein
MVFYGARSFGAGNRTRVREEGRTGQKQKYSLFFFSFGDGTKGLSTARQRHYPLVNLHPTNTMLNTQIMYELQRL